MCSYFSESRSDASRVSSNGDREGLQNFARLHFPAMYAYSVLHTIILLPAHLQCIYTHCTGSLWLYKDMWRCSHLPTHSRQTFHSSRWVYNALIFVIFHYFTCSVLSFCLLFSHLYCYIILCYGKNQSIKYIFCCLTSHGLFPVWIQTCLQVELLLNILFFFLWVHYHPKLCECSAHPLRSRK